MWWKKGWKKRKTRWTARRLVMHTAEQHLCAGLCVRVLLQHLLHDGNARMEYKTDVMRMLATRLAAIGVVPSFAIHAHTRAMVPPPLVPRAVTERLRLPRWSR